MCIRDRNRAVSFYANAKARIAEEKEKSESLKLEQASSKIVTGDELRRFFDKMCIRDRIKIKQNKSKQI